MVKLIDIHLLWKYIQVLVYFKVFVYQLFLYVQRFLVNELIIFIYIIIMQTIESDDHSPVHVI